MTFSLFPPEARVRIHSFSGSLVRELRADAFGRAQWDGADAAGGPAASGVYFVFIEGNGTRKTMKIIVQR